MGVKLSFTPSNSDVPHKHFAIKTKKLITHNQNLFSLSFFFTDSHDIHHPQIPLSSLPLALKTHKPIPLSTPNYLSLANPTGLKLETRRSRPQCR